MAFLKKAMKWLAPGVEPSEEKKAQGFGNGEYPAAGHFDRMFNATYEAIEELQEKAGEVKKVNNQSPDSNGNVNINIDTSNLATKTELETAGAAIQEEIDNLGQNVATHKADYLQHTGYAATTGSANAYIATLTPALSAYAEGVSLRLKINVDNTGASTVNVNGLGIKAIKKANGADVNAGQLKAGSVYTLVYNGTNFILQGEGSDLSDTDLTNFINNANGILGL